MKYEFIAINTAKSIVNLFFLFDKIIIVLKKDESIRSVNKNIFS